jgi:ABC-2 type transport system permease protein
MELLLAEPVPRGQLLLAHFWVDVLTIPILCLSLWGGTWLGTWLAGLLDVAQPEMRANPWAFGPALFNVAALLFAVSGSTMFLSALGRFRGRVLGLAVLLALLQFLVNLIGQLWETIRFLRPFTIFYYYQPQFIILHSDWSTHAQVWLNFAALGGVGTIGYLLALWAFSRRDLPAPL